MQVHPEKSLLSARKVFKQEKKYVALISPDCTSMKKKYNLAKSRFVCVPNDNNKKGKNKIILMLVYEIFLTDSFFADVTKKNKKAHWRQTNNKMEANKRSLHQ